MMGTSPLFAGALAGLLALSPAMVKAQAVKENGPRAPGEVPPRQMERLGRGVVAVSRGGGRVFVGWRMLGTDPDDVAFNLYRSAAGGEPVKLNPEPIAKATNFVDGGADLGKPNAYSVRAVREGREQDEAGGSFPLPAHAPERSYISIPLQTLPGHTPNDASVGDLDGDGEYEVVLKQEMRPRDNSQRGRTGETKLEAYRLDGTFLWRINLGKNIREGAHYTPFLVYDFDGDGKAEIACKTADATVDGAGKVLGDPDADHRNASGYVLDGPEFLTVFDGLTGRALATTDYVPARGRVGDWGDDYGNRVDRFLAAVAYLDGRRPSLIMCRGYYTRTVLAAWNWREGKLTRAWTFDSDGGTPDHRRYRGQGNHNLAVGDVDGDGRDEIVYGACCVDDDGKGLYSSGLGHGDALHLSDIDPDRPGLEVFDIHEKATHPHGAEFRDARTGALIWSKPSRDVGRGVSMDIDPRHRGYEQWAAGPGLHGLWNTKGEAISERRPRSCNFGVWWDGDLLREVLDGTTITKWAWQSESETTLLSVPDCKSNNSTKATPCLCADLFGDWREEVIWRSADNQELRIYTTTSPTEHRLRTLMHDPQYRLSVAWQNVGYNQPTQPGFYLGDGMAPPPRPAIRTTPGTEQGNGLTPRMSGPNLSSQGGK
jgi:rhamnogalacturonan endolyase